MVVQDLHRSERYKKDSTVNHDSTPASIQNQIGTKNNEKKGLNGFFFNKSF